MRTRTYCCCCCCCSHMNSSPQIQCVVTGQTPITLMREKIARENYCCICCISSFYVRVRVLYIFRNSGARYVQYCCNTYQVNGYYNMYFHTYVWYSSIVNCMLDTFLLLLCLYQVKIPTRYTTYIGTYDTAASSAVCAWFIFTCALFVYIIYHTISYSGEMFLLFCFIINFTFQLNS